MRDSRLTEILSAYLDGESDDPRAVEKLLIENPDAARRLRELRTLSNSLKSLPEPELNPMFVTRVMGGIAATRQTRHPGRLALLPAGALACLLIATAALWLSRPAQQPDNDAPLEVAGIQTLRHMDPGALDDIVQQGIEESQLYSDYSADDLYNQDTSDGDPLELLASADWVDDLATAVESQTDIDSLLENLDETETGLLREQLILLAMEG